MSMSSAEMDRVAAAIKYKEWTCRISGDEFYESLILWWEWKAPCVLTGEVKKQLSRSWHIDSDITEEGIVRTAFAAAKMAEEHECAENFKYQGRRIFDPHRAVL
ncbi:hypothetical protein VAC51_00036 [Variovorax phage VAC_51]|uniref:Uncharacterized protein n=1 Tax=Variovorax phage VAC_51 TaxID=2985242 RepID=A0A9N6WV95_9CAUD|nr:hypothetical protein VAC51_00036 [Variovorax phage VAC_51]